MRHICDHEKERGDECNVSFPENLNAFETWGFYVTISGKSDCEFGLAPLALANSGSADFYYVSESGKVDGRESYGSKYDLDFSKGWNVVYKYYYDNDRNREYTTDPSKVGELEWWIYCDDD